MTPGQARLALHLGPLGLLCLARPLPAQFVLTVVALALYSCLSFVLPLVLRVTAAVAPHPGASSERRPEDGV